MNGEIMNQDLYGFEVLLYVTSPAGRDIIVPGQPADFTMEVVPYGVYPPSLLEALANSNYTVHMGLILPGFRLEKDYLSLGAVFEGANLKRVYQAVPLETVSGTKIIVTSHLGGDALEPEYGHFAPIGNGNVYIRWDSNTPQIRANLTFPENS